MATEITRQEYENLLLENPDSVYRKYTGIETYSIEDYKTSSTKPSNTMPFGYKMQQMAYAYMLRAQGHTVEKISLIYVTRPTKTLPARLFPVHHIITSQDWKAIEDVLSLISESVQLVRQQPELTHLIFKSMSLKPKQ